MSCNEIVYRIKFCNTARSNLANAEIEFLRALEVLISMLTIKIHGQVLTFTNLYCPILRSF